MLERCPSTDVIGVVGNKIITLIQKQPARDIFPSLAGGKIEKGESIEKAAVREVEEECGISQISLGKQVIPSFHLYMLKGKMHLKKTWWCICR